jgi:eukaryotic-like serine/threonine-protein kinase
MGDIFMDRYASAEFLGRGSMGSVYRAHPLDEPGRDVVVKVMLPHIAAQPRFRQHFEREIQSMARLRHPYIVRLLDFSFDDPRGPCLVMEFIPDKTLEALLSTERRLSVGRTGLLLGVLCHALESAHLLGIIHRDLKPANLMVVNAGTLDESLRVMDFGLAHLSSKPHFTVERLAGASRTTAQGTPRYICPEQLRGDEVEARSDLYSVGVMLFEMLTGAMPFPHNDVDKLLCAHVHEKPLSFAQAGGHDIPAAVEQVVQHCLSKFAAERPGSARELAAFYSEAIGIDIWEAAHPENFAESEEVNPEPQPVSEPERNAIVHELGAWMPEPIAVVKLRGFLEEIGGKVVVSEPGLLRIRLGEPENADRGQRHPFLDANGERAFPIEIEMRMEKPDSKSNRLNLTVLFRPFTDPILLHVSDWRSRCENLYNDLQSYLMAR